MSLCVFFLSAASKSLFIFMFFSISYKLTQLFLLVVAYVWPCSESCEK